MLAPLARLFRRAGPAVAVTAPARLAILTAGAMPSLDRRLARVRRLRAVIPQFAAKIARAARHKQDTAALIARRDTLAAELDQHLIAIRAETKGLV
jgi:hypothetical protein